MRGERPLQRQMAGDDGSDDTRPGNDREDDGPSNNDDDEEEAATTPVTEHRVPPAVVSPSSVESTVSIETIRPTRNCPSLLMSYIMGIANCSSSSRDHIDDNSRSSITVVDRTSSTPPASVAQSAPPPPAKRPYHAPPSTAIPRQHIFLILSTAARIFPFPPVAATARPRQWPSLGHLGRHLLHSPLLRPHSPQPPAPCSPPATLLLQSRRSGLQLRRRQ